MKIEVSKNGEILSPELYDWNENTKTFSTNLSELVLDFGEINGVTINSGSVCTIKCGYYCTIKCGNSCTIKCGNSCTINSGFGCTIKCGYSCTIRTYWDTIIFPGSKCSIHYCYQEFNTLEHLIENEFQQILKTGELIKLKEIEYKEILFKENVFTYLLKENQKFNFYIDDKFNEQLFESILEDNHSKLLMLQNENNTNFIKHFIKTFKKATHE